jgi:hypothetical protein
MTERLDQPSGSGPRMARRRTAWSRASGVWGSRTIPAIPPIDVDAASGPTILGFPAEVPEASDAAEPDPGGPEPDVATSSVELVFLRRPDRVAGGALVLAGAAANASLLLSWSPGEGAPGLSLVQRGVELLGADVALSAYSGVWQPLVVVLSGGVYILLGLLLLVPARTHRLVGVLALAVALAAATAVVLLVTETGWLVERVGPGMWCAVAVPVLGLMGALKAMLTAPLVTIEPGERHPVT